MVSIGGVGRFQLLAFVLIACGISSVSFICNIIPFYTKEPVYECVWAGVVPDHPEKVCTSENICAGDLRIESWSIDWYD